MRRFISRRGKPSLIKSDRGTNFTAAESELRKSMQKFDIDWQFLPAGASHMNGVVERQIRTIRKVFTGLLTDEQRLTDDILATLFCEVEGIVNSRPLTKVSDDPSDDAAMTPSDLLIVITIFSARRTRKVLSRRHVTQKMALHSTLGRDVLEALPERIHSTTAEAHEMDQGEEIRQRR